MAAKGSPNRNTVATITDSKGKVIIEIRQEEYLIIGKDGSITSYSLYNNIILEDGMAWSPALLSGPKPIHIGACDICRSRRRSKSHGLVAMAHARLCVCGKLCCPKHRRQGADEKWRCPSCAHKYSVKRMFRPFFFRKKE